VTTKRINKYAPDTIIQGDCLSVMRDIPSGSVDLTVTSPPYDNLRKYNGYTFDFEPIARELFRITKKGGVVVWVVGDATINGSETGTSFKQALYFKEIGFNLETMIYEVAGTGAKGSNYYYWQSFEYMFVLSIGNPKTSNRIADIRNTGGGIKRHTTPKSTLLKSRTDRTGIVMPIFSIRPNVWRYHHADSSDIITHPAPFPEKLARDHILSWSNEGDLVFDPMCGSGTTLKMAATYKRHFLGCDISEEYCRIAERRVANAVQQITIGV